MYSFPHMSLIHMYAFPQETRGLIVWGASVRSWHLEVIGATHDEKDTCRTTVVCNSQKWLEVITTADMKEIEDILEFKLAAGYYNQDGSHDFI
jgi:hypothetical protein